MTFVHKHPKPAKIVKANFLVAFIALGIGGLFGLIQGLHRTGVFDSLITSTQFYTILTGHGVLLALVFTTFFIAGLFHWGVTRSLEREPENHTLSWIWFSLMTVGTIMATAAILGGLVPGSTSFRAAVLYTFYPPMQAHPVFYFGALFLIIGSWMAGAQWFMMYRKWRAEHPNDKIPLQSFMVLYTMLMWYICTLGVALEVIVLLIPWSMGMVDKIDPLLPRTLFWYFGHALVYFWLLPAYFVWYSILPKLAGGRLFSDSMTRVTFIIFLILSTPIGYHHQYADPGISVGFKFYAMVATLLILLPSLITFFTVIASMEHGAKQRGGSGKLGWLKALPWNNPAFVGCALAGLMFAAGGFSGMINASMNINILIHNTLWVPGHFHLTVGTAVALTFMAVTYWLLPQMTGRKIKHNTMALIQPYLWFLGMTLMSNAMHRGGLAGIPRRVAETNYLGFEFEAVLGSIPEIQWQIAMGGVLLFISMVLFLWVVTASWLGGEVSEHPVDDYLPPALSGPEHSPAILDNMKLWIGLAILLIIVAYSIPLADMVMDGLFWPGAPGIRI
ncbi:MAG: b(o/a)3-type cytochrome-c oxidase subunit 1 [Bacteroidota bacterium]